MVFVTPRLSGEEGGCTVDNIMVVGLKGTHFLRWEGCQFVRIVMGLMKDENKWCFSGKGGR